MICQGLMIYFDLAHSGTGLVPGIHPAIVGVLATTRSPLLSSNSAEMYLP
jgi:hypothetical protein